MLTAKRLLYFLGILCFSGCASFSFQMAEVVLDNPEAELNIQKVEPNAAEKQGVLLRLLPPKENRSDSEENTRIYAQVQNGKGLRLDLKQKTVSTFMPSGQPPHYRVRSVSTFLNAPGEIVEDIELSPRGEIMRIHEVSHHSKSGDFAVTTWKRSPLFPEEKVRIGETWSHKETLDAQIKSFWVKRDSPSPAFSESRSTLTGFALVQVIRCAVISTHTTQRKKENLKVLFKRVQLDIQTTSQNTTYLDYSKGKVIARVTRIQSRSESPELPAAQEGMSQSIYKAFEKKENMS